VQQHINSDGHRSKSKVIAFSSLLDKFGVNAEDAHDSNCFRNSWGRPISCSQTHSFLQFIWLYFV